MTSRPDADAEASSDAFSRLHPAVLVVWAWKGLASLVVVLVFTGLLRALVATGRFPWEGLGLVAVLGLLLGLRYLRFRWRAGAEAVVIEQGLLLRKRRIIPRERIQSVDLRRGIVHRLLGVVEVRIEAIGGTDTQGKLAAVAPDVASELRRSLLETRTGATPPGIGSPDHVLPPPGSIVPAQGDPNASEGEIWAEVQPGQLVLAGITGGRVGVMAALIGFFLQLVPEEGWVGVLGPLMDQVPDPTTGAGIRLLALVGFAVLLASFLLSVGASVIAHWGFTLTAWERRLTVRRGLVTQHHDTVPLGRIQAVRVEENLIRRIFGLASVHAVVAGRPAGPDADPGSGLLLPIARREEAWRIARRVIGLEGEGGAPALVAMPRRALRRRVARAAAAAAATVAAAAVLAWDGEAGMRLGVVLPAVAAGTLLPALLVARAAYRGLGWADLGGHIAVREGVFNRRTTLLPVGRLQAVETTESPFQRWSGLATVHLRVARPLFDPSPRGLDMSRADAYGWREHLARRPTPATGPGAERPVR